MKNSKDLLFRQGKCEAMCDHVYVSVSELICDYGCKAYDSININYCPMCGRPLKGEDI